MHVRVTRQARVTYATPGERGISIGGAAPPILIEDVEIEGKAGLSVLIRDGLVHNVGPREVMAESVAAANGSPGPAGGRIVGRGAALLPGLHDHHIHLFASAARAESVWCGPPDVTSEVLLLDRLRSAAEDDPGEGWIRAVGWDDTLAGWPDRWTLDAAVADRPIRLQHRSGAMWVLNSTALGVVGLGSGRAPRSGADTGVERDADGAPTGRLTGLDAWMRGQIATGPEVPPSLRRVSVELASRGVTGVTDATAHNGPRELAALAASRSAGELAQRVVAMTRDAEVAFPEGVEAGPVKLVLFDPDLPPITDLVTAIADAHEHDRAVALHAASRVGVLLAVAALADAGARPGDRIEHASVVPDEMLRPIAELGVTVVTQPHFIAESGDRYRATVAAEDQPWLYRGRGFLTAGIPLAAGSDAPVGGSDPWVIMSAAVERRTTGGDVMEPGERLTPEQALRLFTGRPDRPGGPPRRIERGAPADLCLLDRPWRAAREMLADVGVRATISGGHVVHKTK